MCSNKFLKSLKILTNPSLVMLQDFFAQRGVKGKLCTLRSFQVHSKGTWGLGYSKCTQGTWTLQSPEHLGTWSVKALGHSSTSGTRKAPHALGHLVTWGTRGILFSSFYFANTKVTTLASSITSSVSFLMIRLSFDDCILIRFRDSVK